MFHARRPSDAEFPAPWSVASDDEFGPEDTFGPDGVAEDPSVFRRAVTHAVNSLTPDGPSEESQIHDQEIADGSRAVGPSWLTEDAS
jgi:hypothetical protein